MNSKLMNIYNQIPKSSCPPGCGKCCGILYPSLAEIRNIKDWCLQHNREFKEFTMIVEDDCPYLSPGKECSIYPVRPFLCRILGVSKDLPCPLKKCNAGKLLNHSQSSHIYSQLYLQGKEKSRIEKHREELREILEAVL
jgi:Fe-S-cluster containining protein